MKTDNNTNCGKAESLFAIYEEPTLRVIEMEVEQGIAQSDENFTFGGGYDEWA